jgi:16S rRNA (cytosine1402-N4)-methyltransferase
MTEIHLPVSLERTIELLSPAIVDKSHPILVDATLGLAGHSYELLRRFPQLTIIGIDRDSAAIDLAKKKLESFGSRVHIYRDTYDNLASILDNFGTQYVDGILLDLGVSSLQLDDLSRGFSYSHHANLDMRMDQSQELTAAKILATYSQSDLARILREFGEEKFASKIAREIISVRQSAPINDTATLVDLIKRVIPAPARRIGGNPAKRTFQALRIEVNGELKILDRALPIALSRLAVGARMVVLSFQSLEDKIVKRHFAQVSQSRQPAGLPMELPGYDADFALLFNGSEKASQDEIRVNPRAKSVRIRAIKRVAA